MNEYESYDPYGTYETKGEDPYSLLLKMSAWNKAIRSTISDVQESLDGTIERQSQIIQEVDRIELNVLDITTSLDSTVTRVGKLEIRSDSIEISVSNVKSDLSGIDTRVGKIEVRADGIDLSVTNIKNDLSGTKTRVGSVEVRVDSITTQVTSLDIRVGNLGTELATASGNITTLAGRVDLKAEASVVNSLGSRVSTAEVSINSLSGTISSKVSMTDYNGMTIASLINQSASNITIAAQAIDLFGITNVANYLTLGTGFGSNTGIYFKGAAIGIESYGDTLNLNAPDIYLNGRVSMDFPSAPRLASHQQGASVSFNGSGDMTWVVNGSSFTYRKI